MRVYNLTERDVDFHGLLIPMHGGYKDFPSLSYGDLPNRDRDLAKVGMLAFDALPAGWKPAHVIASDKEALAAARKALVTAVASAPTTTVVVSDELKIEAGPMPEEAKESAGLFSRKKSR